MPIRLALGTRSRRVPRSSTAGTALRTRSEENPLAVFRAFLDRLRAVRVLDPACGSGNFLIVSLWALKDLEWEAIQWGSLVLRHHDARVRSGAS
jgi:hypothetical protein